MIYSNKTHAKALRRGRAESCHDIGANRCGRGFLSKKVHILSETLTLALISQLQWRNDKYSYLIIDLIHDLLGFYYNI